MADRKTGKMWTKTKVQNLIKHRNGVYYARLYRKGKEQWKSLKTELLEVAKGRLREFAGEVEGIAAAQDAQIRGKMTFGEAAAVFLEKLKLPDLVYRENAPTEKESPKAASVTGSRLCMRF